MKETRRNGIRGLSRRPLLGGAGLVDVRFIPGSQGGTQGEVRHPEKDSEVMAVTLSDAELSAGMMLTGAVGDVLDTPPEPVLGRIQRFKVSRDCNHKRAHSNGTRGRTERVRDQIERHIGGINHRRPECPASPTPGSNSVDVAWSLPTGHSARSAAEL